MQFLAGMVAMAETEVVGDQLVEAVVAVVMERPASAEPSTTRGYCLLRNPVFLAMRRMGEVVDLEGMVGMEILQENQAMAAWEHQRPGRSSIRVSRLRFSAAHLLGTWPRAVTHRP